MAVKVSPKYQVVIPENVRNTLKIKVGTKVEVIAKGKVAYLVPVPDLDEVQEELKGKINQSHLREKKDRLE